MFNEELYNQKMTKKMSPRSAVQQMRTTRGPRSTEFTYPRSAVQWTAHLRGIPRIKAPTGFNIGSTVPKAQNLGSRKTI